jgi:hypothetical protein
METAFRTMERGWTHHTQVKKAPPPYQKEHWTMLSHPGHTRVTLKKTVVKLFFLFHLGNGMFIINITQSTFPLTVEFNACQILPCRGLMSQLQLQEYSFYICPILGPTGKPGICPKWLDVE